MNKHFQLLFAFSVIINFSTRAQYGNGAMLQIVSGSVFESGNQRFGGIYGADIGYVSTLQNNNKEWKRFLNAKELIWTLHWRDMNGLKNATDSVQNFGNAIGLSMSADFELWNTGHVQFEFTPTFGLSYFTKTSTVKYSEQVGVGSRINDLISAGLNAIIQLTSKMSLVAGLNYMHCSNAGFQEPNVGINSLSIKLGLISRFKQKKQASDSIALHSVFKQPEKSSFEFSAGIGRRGVDYSQKGFFRSGLYAGYNYFFNQVIGLKAGFDAIYYRTVFDPAYYAQTFQDYYTSYDHFATGISVGIELAMNKFVITYQTGKYLHFDSPFSIKGYWKSGFCYYFTPAFGITSVAYLYQLSVDFVNWGIVWRIK